MAGKYMSPVERADEELKRLSGEPTEQPEATDEAEQEETAEQEAEANEPSQEEPESKKAPQPEDDNSPTYKQRWEALQGLFNGEKRKVEQLQQQMQSLQQKLDQASQSESSGAPLASDATQGEIADHLNSLAVEFGDDFTKALQGVMRGEIQSILDQRLKPMEERVGQVAQDSEEAQRDRFNATLEALAPNWQGIYATDAFHQWLDTTVDDMAGVSFRQLFNDANEKWDTNRIARFFNTFNNATGKTSSKKEDTVKQEDPREKLVAPGRGSSGNSAAANQPKMWTIQEVNQFFRDYQQGAFRGREEEAAKIEADIDRANMEGRIR